MTALTSDSLRGVIIRCAMVPNHKALIVMNTYEQAWEIFRDFQKEMGSVDGLYTARRNSKRVEFRNNSEIIVKSASENLRGLRVNTVLFDSAITDSVVLDHLRRMEACDRDNVDDIIERLAMRIHNERTMRSVNIHPETTFESMCESTRRSLEDWINNNVKREFLKMSFPNSFKSKPDPVPEQEDDTSELDEFLDTFIIN